MPPANEWPSSEEQAEWGARISSGENGSEVWRLVLKRLAEPIASILSSKDSRLSRDDLAAQTMLQLVAKRRLYSAERGSLQSFVFVVAKSAAVDMLRKVGAERPMTKEAESSLECQESAGEISAAVVRLIDELDKLSPLEREIVVASASADGASYAAELATKHGISAPHVRVIAGRVRERLRSALS